MWLASVVLVLLLAKLSVGFVLRVPSSAKGRVPSSRACLQRWARPGPIVAMRASGEGADGDTEGDAEGQPQIESIPTNRPLTSVEKRRIARASKTDSARKLSKNQRVLDDFIGKRMGQGTAFYGCVGVCVWVGACA